MNLPWWDRTWNHPPQRSVRGHDNWRETQFLAKNWQPGRLPESHQYSRTTKDIEEGPFLLRSGENRWLGYQCLDVPGLKNDCQTMSWTKWHRNSLSYQCEGNLTNLSPNSKSFPAKTPQPASTMELSARYNVHWWEFAFDPTQSDVSTNSFRLVLCILQCLPSRVCNISTWGNLLRFTVSSSRRNSIHKHPREWRK